MADDSAFKLITWTGDDAVSRPITWTGDFVPDGVMVHCTATGGNTMWLRTNSHAGTTCSDMRTGALPSDVVSGLLTNGFTVGHGAQTANAAGEPYIAIAFRHTSGVVQSGFSAPGDIVVLGWAALVLFFTGGGFFSTLPGFTSLTDITIARDFSDGTDGQGQLFSLDATGFQLRNDARPLAGLHWIAFGEDGVRADHQTYIGNDTSQSVSTDVRPQIAIVFTSSNLGAFLPWFKTISGMTGANSTAMHATSFEVNEITDLNVVAPYTVSIGAGVNVNTSDGPGGPGTRGYELLILDTQDEPAEPEPPPGPASSTDVARVAAGGGGIELAITQSQRTADAQSLHPVDDCLSKMGTRLHDDGTVWPEVELLDWYNDGYRELLSLSGAIRRHRPIPLPPRRAMTITQEWEDRHADGPVGKVTHATGGGYYQTVGEWEVEQSVA